MKKVIIGLMFLSSMTTYAQSDIKKLVNLADDFATVCIKRDFKIIQKISTVQYQKRTSLSEDEIDNFVDSNAECKEIAHAILKLGKFTQLTTVRRRNLGIETHVTIVSNVNEHNSEFIIKLYGADPE